MLEKAQTTLQGLKWFQWAAMVGFGLVAGLLIIIVINTRSHPSGETEVKQIQAEVSRHVLLPMDETPALATITDPAKLAGNPLLAQARKGDKVLIYAKWKQAVIFRPSADRVVDIGPVDVAPPGGDTTGYSPLK